MSDAPETVTAISDRRSLGKAITSVENDRDDAGDILAGIADLTGNALVVGITGPPGVGKSTLTNALIGAFRGRGQTVAVVAVDPSSPFGGGAILGDRIRMGDHSSDPGVFVRSVASRGHLGGLSRATARVVDVLDGAGFDIVLVETVGTGQAEIDIMHLAHTVLVVAAPGLGDEVQAIKAGIFEIADVFVVNKADTPLANKTVRTLHDALSEPDDGWTQPIIPTVATEGTGIDELVEAIDAHTSGLEPTDRADAVAARARRQLAAAASDLAADRVTRSDDPSVADLTESVRRGEVALDDAAEQALDITNRSPGGDR